MHAEHLLDHIELALRAARCEREQLNKIAVGTGPGNFTGLRVGIALASGIGLGLGIPVVGVCSLASMAAAVVAPEISARFVVRDARRGEFFCAAYALGGETLIAPELVAGARLFEWLVAQCAAAESSGRRTAVVGDGLQCLTAPQKAGLATCLPEQAALITPDAQHTATIGLEMTSTGAVVPAYVREADAVLPQLPRNAALDPRANGE
jgi:tRNA threonylcarbamoyladenosine biosynthesis protein TsaB